jgi:hypothetical protein
MDTENTSTNSNSKPASPAKPGSKNQSVRAGGIGVDKKRLRRNRLNSFLNNYFHIFTILAIAGMLFDGYWYILRPQYDEIAGTLRKNIDERKVICTNKKTELANLQGVVNVYSGLNPDDLKKFDGLVPMEASTETTKDELWNEVAYLVITKSGFKVSAMNVLVNGNGGVASVANASPDAALPGATRSRSAISTPDAASVPMASSAPAPSGVSRALITLSIENIDYAGLRKVLNVFENSLRVLDISDLEYNPLNRSVKFTIGTYYFPGSGQ